MHARNGGRLFGQARRTIDAYRSSASRSKAPEDERFHKDIDAWMVTLSRQLHNVHGDRHKLTFVGPDGLRGFYDDQKDKYSRQVMVPYTLLRAFQCSETAGNRKKEVEARLKKGLLRIDESLEDLERAGSFENLAQAEIESIADARDVVTGWLYEREDPAVRRQKQLERMEKLMKSKQQLKDKIKQSRDSAKTTAKKIVEIMPEILSDDLLESYDLRRNERMNAIMRKLDLK